MRRAHTPTLPELQAFVQAARTGSATRAAAALALTQSAVSRSLGTLESRLGVALFHRVRQRLILSDAGRAFLPEAERLLADLDRAALAVMSFGGRAQVLRLAALPSFGQVWLIPRLARFAAVAPEISFDVSVTLLPLDFDRDARDAAILRGPAPRGQHSAVLAEERLVAVAAPHLVPGGGLTDGALARLPLLQQATRPELWLDWFRDGGVPTATLMRGPRFEQFGQVLAAARAGMGAALVPEVLAAGDLASGTLRRASPRAMLGPQPYVLCWPDRTDALPAFRAFRGWLAADGRTPPRPPAPEDTPA